MVTPPTKSDNVGFLIKFSKSLPCAVPINCTPLSAIVRHANASISVPISSTIIISGVWFSTASIIILCCSIGFGTCIRRALPIAGCGISPSPPISLDVSIITTLFCKSSDNTLAISRITVVFPTPGFPRNNTESPLSLFNTSEIISTCPVTALPTRQVKPIIFPLRFRMHEILCNVPVTPARLSPPNSPTTRSAWSNSSCVTTFSLKTSLCFLESSSPLNLASGCRPRSKTISKSFDRFLCFEIFSRTSSGTMVNISVKSS